MGARGWLRALAALLVLLGCAGEPGRSAEARRAAGVITVPPGGSLQRAVDDARPGDIILLAAGGRYVGPVRLRRKSADEWITLQSAPSLTKRIPPQGTRVARSDADAMAKILTSAGPAVIAEPGAHHYRFVGIEIAPAPGIFTLNLVDLGNPRSAADVAHHLVFERCYIHGDPHKGSRRGIALNSAETTIRDSYVADFKEVGADSQAVAGWSGPGPFHLVNNFLEGAGENLMFGGADPLIQDLVPSDIEITRNTFAKPLEWRIGDLEYQGTPWTIKNLLELKNARRVRIEGNLFQYHWPQAQNGFAILFTVRNQESGAPWSVVEDVSFVNNTVRHVAAGINILGKDDLAASRQTRRILIRNNVFIDIGRQWGMGRLFQLLNGTADVTIDHNTAFQSETLLMGGDTAAHTGLVFQNNIAPHNQYGIIGSGTGVGRPTLERYFPGAVVRRNVFAGGNASLYPADNFFPGSLDDVKWLDPATENFRLAPTSPYRGKGSDGRDLGADLNAIQAAMAGRTVRPAAPAADSRVRSAVAMLVLLLSAALIGYSYVGYGAAIWFVAQLRQRLIQREAIEPSVAVVVVAHNEAARIHRRILNLLAVDYPEHLLNVVVASDGSTDDTVELASSVGGRVRVVACPVRRGKPAVLNEVIASLTAEIVVLADARQTFDRGAIRAMVSCLGDPTVGVVSGELMLASAYWTYEKRIRCAESQVDSTVGATGAIYAIRRSAFQPIPDDTILDDVLIPMRIARQGLRVVFEPAARAYDVPATPAHEFARKVRTIAGNIQLFARDGWLLRPAENRLWFQTWSHKAIRLALPFLYAALFASNVALADDGSFFRVLLAGQGAFYAVAAAGYLVPAARRVVPLASIPYEICFLNWAALVGLVKYAAGCQRVTWKQPSVSTPA